MPDRIGTNFLENNVNGAALLDMQEENFKAAGVSKVVPLTLLSKGIAKLRRKKTLRLRLHLLIIMHIALGISQTYFGY